MSRNSQNKRLGKLKESVVFHHDLTLNVLVTTIDALGHF